MNLPTGLNPFDLTGRDRRRDRSKPRNRIRNRRGACAAAGADIIGVSANIDDSPIVETVTALGQHLHSRSGRDFTDRAQVLRAAARIAELGPDILVNNAGTIERAPAA